MADNRRGQLYMLLAALSWSSGGLLQRALLTDTTTQIVGRAFFAAIAILAFVIGSERRQTVNSFRGMGWAGATFAVCIAISSASFMAALNATSVANVLVLQALTPLVASFLARVFLNQELSRQTLAAIALSLAGVVIMVGAPGSALSYGVALAGLMAVTFAVGVVIAGSRTDTSMAPASCLAQVLLVAFLWPMAHLAAVEPRDLFLLALLGAGQMGVGLVLFTLGARLIPASTVALISLLQVVLGPMWVWLGRGEVPAPGTLAGGVIIVTAVAWSVLQARAAPPFRASGAI